ncbi:hypothetical protein [Azospirillum sp. TSO22-1]|uniref:hypothetical protein n=1 Tax=Azospirillum sp. TSO22-1 TaxID=716789 RepID=UPI000D6158BF|nr:hypothetical protein [Azospirillum sp. TSO22-1]PWC55156.1 hypothetical protein TSO221_05985 [Azospirillum sp. TSO22-1]
MKELRCLVFTEQEVVKAVLDRRRKVRDAMPIGTVQGVVYTMSYDTVTTTIRIIDDHGGDQSLMLGPTEVAAALVGYCMGRRVPLPVDADKCLHLINGALTLMITMNFKKAPRMVAETHTATHAAEQPTRLAS